MEVYFPGTAHYWSKSQTILELQFPSSLRTFIHFKKVTGEEVMTDFLLINIILRLVHKVNNSVTRCMFHKQIHFM
jgi:hypothetical protein